MASEASHRAQHKRASKCGEGTSGQGAECGEQRAKGGCGERPRPLDKGERQRPLAIPDPALPERKIPVQRHRGKSYSRAQCIGGVKEGEEAHTHLSPPSLQPCPLFCG